MTAARSMAALSQFETRHVKNSPLRSDEYMMNENSLYYAGSQPSFVPNEFTFDVQDSKDESLIQGSPPRQRRGTYASDGADGSENLAKRRNQRMHAICTKFDEI